MSIFTMKMIFGIRRYQQIKEKQIVDASICREASSSAIERKTRCNHRSASILKCHRKKSKMQLPGGKHLQVPQKEKQDAITRLQASSSAIERKARCNHRAASIFKCNRKKKQDAIIGRQASSSTIERKARYTNQAASIFKCHRKKNKMQSPGCKHLQVPQKEKQDAITKQQASSSAIERKARCNHQAASILKCHRKKNKMQSPGGKHPQLPQKEKSSSAIERKTRCNHRSASILKYHRKKNKMQLPGGKHLQVQQKEKTRCNHRAASILKYYRKKNKIQLLIRDHLQNMENTS